MKGWIKLYRKLLESNMYRNLNSKQRDVMIACLLLANHDDNEWEWDGKLYKCKPGQFITSLEKITSFCANDIKVQSVRTALLKLEKWHFLTNQSTKAGRLITICNWDSYQDDEKQTNKQTNKELTKSQQRANKELTTNKNDIRMIKNDKENIIENFDFLIFEFENGVEELFKEWLHWREKTNLPVSETLINQFGRDIVNKSKLKKVPQIEIIKNVLINGRKYIEYFKTSENDTRKDDKNINDSWGEGKKGRIITGDEWLKEKDY